MSMLEPNKTSKLDRSFRKVKKGKIRAMATKNYSLANGDYGIKVMESCRLSSKQIEAARRVMIRTLGKKVKLIIRVFPQKPITKKAAETRRGGGKGSFESWTAILPAGTMVFEFDASEEVIALDAHNAVKYKMPAKTKLIWREI
jgi:large subunit ribosomal protein L16